MFQEPWLIFAFADKPTLHRILEKDFGLLPFKILKIHFAINYFSLEFIVYG